MQVERPKLSWTDRLYLPAIAKGMSLTLKHLFSKKVTMQYPEERPTLHGNYRGMPVLVTDQDDRVKCVACQMCEFVCPPKAIRIKPGVRAQTAPDARVEKEPEEFELDLLRCIYCGLCQEACPEEAIFLKRVYVATGYTRQEMLIPKERLLQLGGTHQDSIMKWKNK
ncbi:MAG TPA: NADH-quinone oxidoreductase subunit I [Polyangiaceae bacterium]|jgi:NADH-quinone oxidoreductase subunit I|nr:NADH-quinone oxidoreductase subunit I [Polyangiaceae bacterium]